MWAGLCELDAADEQKGPSAGRLSSFSRPSPETDRLYTVSGKAETAVEHPPVTPNSMRHQRPQKPLVHFGVVATGGATEYPHRQRLLEERNVRAFDVGFQAVLESVDGNRKESLVLVKGVCDYEHGTTSHRARRGDVVAADWRPYSSLSAAAVMKCIVLGVIVPNYDDDDDDD